MTDHFSGAVTAPAERAAPHQNSLRLQILLGTRGSEPRTEAADRGEPFDFHWEAEERR